MTETAEPFLPDGALHVLASRGDELEIDRLALRCALSVDAGDELSRPHAKIHLLRDPSGRIVAFSLVWLIADDAEIQDLGVLPEARQQGLGLNLLRAIVNAYPERKLLLEVSHRNAAALRLYEKAGFRRVGRRQGYYQDGSDALLLERPVSAMD